MRGRWRRLVPVQAPTVARKFFLPCELVVLVFKLDLDGILH